MPTPITGLLHSVFGSFLYWPASPGSPELGLWKNIRSMVILRGKIWNGAGFDSSCPCTPLLFKDRQPPSYPMLSLHFNGQTHRNTHLYIYISTYILSVPNACFLALPNILQARILIGSKMKRLSAFVEISFPLVVGTGGENNSLGC